MYANGYGESFSEKQRREYEAELSAATFNKAILQDNGLFTVYNIREDDITNIMYKLNKLDFIEWVQKIYRTL